MKSTLIALLILCSLFTQAQNTFNCDSLLTSKLNYDVADPNELFNSFKLLRHCGLDSIDVELLLTPQVVGALVVGDAGKRELTYDSVLQRLKPVLASDEYKQMKENAGLIFAKRNWDKVMYQQKLKQAEAKAAVDPEPPAKCPGCTMRRTYYGIPSLVYIDEALKYSRKVKKPVLLWFNGFACVNCNKMRDVVYVDKELSNYIKEHFVLLDLHVDDFTELPEEKKYRSETLNKEVTNWGTLRVDYQLTKYGTQHQPVLYIINHKEKVLAEMSYTNSVHDFMKFLEKGLDNY